jgi:hypothetical protein
VYSSIWRGTIGGRGTTLFTHSGRSVTLDHNGYDGTKRRLWYSTGINPAIYTETDHVDDKTASGRGEAARLQTKIEGWLKLGPIQLDDVGFWVWPNVQFRLYITY